MELKHTTCNPADLPKGYESKNVEQIIYEFWETNGFFKPKIDPGKTPFVISMPPPNVTGALHTGHALANTMEDLMIRYHRMRGEPVLWVPGEDHAGIATQAVVEKHLAKEKLTRQKLGREKFIERVWEWVAEYKKRIQYQSRRFGVSCDWERERFTLDAGLSRAVREVFVRLYEEGLLYRGKRIINWCPRCYSAISDLEVINQDTPGQLTYISYPLEPQAGDPPKGLSIIVATTRPETMLGDTAIAVNPQDSRFKDLIGRTAIVPLMNRPIPIIADDSVEMEFGTGAVKVTPAHDPTDFETGLRHSLPQIQVIGFDAKMTEDAGVYVGLDRYEARKHVLADLASLGRIEKQEAYTIPIGHCERCDTVIEPLISEQWFVKMTSLATPALNAVKYGQIQILPERSEKTYIDWLTNIRDWNISRQLWWGHRIPAWYCDSCGEVIVSREDITECPRCQSSDIRQDPDVLDTWFSSWLWPFSTLGWPDTTADLSYFYPTAVMETGYDIIFFWVARMVMAGIHFMGTVPFKTIYLHGLIRDQQGRKISKSLKNGLDPIDTIEQYGADALRFTLITSSTPGNDLKLNAERIAGNRNFANKIWNAGRFVMIQTEYYRGPLVDLAEIAPITLADRWIISRAQHVTQSVTALMQDFQFGEAGRQLYEFVWNEFCDWYLEIAKIQMGEGSSEEQRKTTSSILRATLDRALRMLHPFMPFVTEEVWQYLIGSGGAALIAERQPNTANKLGLQPPALIVAPWPMEQARQFDEDAEADFGLIRQMITRIRDARKQQDVEPAKRIPLIIAAGSRVKLLKEQTEIFKVLARTEEPQIKARLTKKPDEAMSLLVENVEMYLPLAGMIDLQKEILRISSELEKTQENINRLIERLNNEQFVARAKSEVVQAERDRLAALEETLKKLEARRKELGR